MNKKVKNYGCFGYFPVVKEFWSNTETHVRKFQISWYESEKGNHLPMFSFLRVDLQERVKP